MYKKAKFVVALILSLAAFGASAEGMQQGMVPNPIKNVTSYDKSDDYSVLVFFKYSCPVCRAYHLSLENWGATLPKPFHVNFMPIVESSPTEDYSKDSLLGLMMFWTMQVAGNQQERDQFNESAYELVQDSHNGENKEAWIRAAANTGVSMPKFKEALKVEQSSWNSFVARQVHYQPEATPTLVICGKWMITPDSTYGNQDLFFQLANGLVSKCMVEHGLAKG